MAYQPMTYGAASPVGINSTATNLAAGAVFTGLAENILIYSNIKVNVYSTHASATDGLVIQQSEDGVSWLSANSDAYTIPATTLKTFSIAANMRFFRVLYTNGATTTTTFLIHVVYHTNDKQPSSVRPQDGRSNDNDFVENLGYLMGYNSAANTWERLRTSIANGLAVDVTRMPTTAVTGTFFQATQPVSGTFFQATQPVSGSFFQATQPVSLGTNTPTIAAGTNPIGNINELRAAPLTVTITSASGVGATLTIPAVAAQFHYITSISISIYATVARVGAAAPLVVTTTNIAGSPAFTFETAQAVGTNTPIQGLNSSTPIKSAAAGVATTIVAPIATTGIWRITVTYFTGV